jgi:AsmA protein
MQLADSVRQATGRDLRIAGSVHVIVLPSIGITAEDVGFANAAWAATPEMAKLKSLEVALRVWPLLQGRIEIARLILTDPEIALEVGKDGVGNWVLATPAAAPAATAGGAGSGRATLPLPDLRLDDVRLDGGRITYIDHRSGSTRSVDHIALHVGLPGLDAPLVVDGGLRWNGQDLRLAFGTARPGALLGGGESPAEVKITAPLLNVAFTGSLAGLPPRSGTGTVDVSSSSLRQLIAWLGTPPALKGDVLGPLAIKGKLAFAGDEIDFSEASFALDTLRADGMLGLATGSAKPLLKGRIKLGPLDLNPYLPESGQGGGGRPVAATSAAPAGWSDAPIDLSALRAADADIAIDADSIRFRALAIDRSQLALTLKDGHLAVDLPELTLYSGNGKGSLTVDASQASPSLALTMAISGTEVGPLLAAVLDTERISGNGNVELSVTGHGGSQRALVGSLDGHGALGLTNGTVKGVNLLGLAESALPGGKGAGGGSTEIGTLTGTFRITDGVVRNDDLQVTSGAVPMTGAGTVDLPQRRVDYKLVPQLAGAIKVPVSISGPWDNLSYRPDAADALKALGQQPGKALDQLKSATPSTAGAAGTLKGLFTRP